MRGDPAAGVRPFGTTLESSLVSTSDLRVIQWPWLQGSCVHSVRVSFPSTRFCGSSYAQRFTIHNDESPPKRPALAPIGSEVALSKSLLHDATFAMENDENVKPALPDCERHGFRQSADFILSRWVGGNLTLQFITVARKEIGDIFSR